MEITLPDYGSAGFKFNNVPTRYGQAKIGDVITLALPYVYSFAGIALLIMLIAGGITLMTAAGDQNKTKQGYGMISNALIGFLIVFVSFLVVQLVEVILGIKIL